MENLKQYHGDIWIPYNTPSSKNNKQWTGKYLISSKNTNKYVKDTKEIWLLNKDKFISLLENKNKPYVIGLHFVRKSKHKFDFINACQIVQDLMVKYEWIADDNMDEMVPQVLFIENKAYSYDKENPGVWIRVI